jgi:hypothetical protein
MTSLGGESGGKKRIIIVDLPYDLWHENCIGICGNKNSGTYMSS